MLYKIYSEEYRWNIGLKILPMGRESPTTAIIKTIAITSGVASLFGSGKLKELEHANEKLQDEVSKRDINIEKLQSQIQQMQKQHDTQIHNLREMHRQELGHEGKGTVTARQNHRQSFQVVPNVQGNASHGKVLCHAWVL